MLCGLDRYLPREHKFDARNDAFLCDTFSHRAARSFDEFSTTGDVAGQDAPRRIREPYLRLAAALLLEIFPGTRERAAGASGADEAIECAARLFPNLRSRGQIVRLGIGGVVKLVRPDCVGEIFGKVACLVIVVCRIVVRDGRDGIDLGAEHAEEVDLFLTLAKTGGCEK